MSPARHLRRRPPGKNGGFSWGRFPADDARSVTWRLFRRDQRGVLHIATRTFLPGQTRAEIAAALNLARHRLRDRVDEIDLALMGVAA